MVVVAGVTGTGGMAVGGGGIGQEGLEETEVEAEE